MQPDFLPISWYGYRGQVRFCDGAALAQNDGKRRCACAEWREGVPTRATHYRHPARSRRVHGFCRCCGFCDGATLAQNDEEGGHPALPTTVTLREVAGSMGFAAAVDSATALRLRRMTGRGAVLGWNDERGCHPASPTTVTLREVAGSMGFAAAVDSATALRLRRMTGEVVGAAPRREWGMAAIGPSAHLQNRKPCARYVRFLARAVSVLFPFRVRRKSG